MRLEVVMFDCKRLKRIEQKLDAILSFLQQWEKTMAASLETLTAQVQANTDAEASAIQLLTGLSALIASLKTDPVALQALADKLKGSSDALAAAIVANTPTP